MTIPNTLTLTDIDDAPACRELDALIAEWVFGYKVDYEFSEPIVKELRDKYDDWGVLPNYSTDISAAWMVVEKIGMDVSGPNFKNKWWAAQIADGDFDSRDWFDLADTAPLAICRAALKSIMTP